jgi:hypothetical protein
LDWLFACNKFVRHQNKQFQQGELFMNYLAKKKLIPTLLSLSFLSLNVQAAPFDPQDTSPVMVGSACNHSIVTSTEQTMGIINSANCKIAYVLPAAKGKMEMASFMATSSTLLCKSYGEYLKGMPENSKAIIRLTAELQRARSSRQRKEIESKIEALERREAVVGRIYRGKQAATAQLVFTNDVEANAINSLRSANYELGRTTGLDFRPAPIGTSILSFKKVNAQNDLESPLIENSIPGLLKKADGSYESVLFNGALSGQVVFSLSGACGLFSTLPRDLTEVSKLKPDPARVASTLVANRSFQVPTRSRMSYEAVLNLDNAVKMMTDFRQTKSKFTVDEFMSKRASGNITQLLDLKVEASELDASQLGNWEALKATLTTEVASRLMDQFTKKLEALGFLQIEPSALPQAPNAGVDYVPGSERVCSSSSVFGFTYDRHCYDRAISIPVQVNGRSFLDAFQSSNINLSIGENLTINQPINYSFTSTFVPAKEN